MKNTFGKLIAISSALLLFYVLFEHNQTKYIGLFSTKIRINSTNVERYRRSYERALESRYVNVGRAPFGIAHKDFKCDDFFKSVANIKYLHVAWLYNTFGRSYRCLRRLTKDKRLMTMQVNLINEPGHRNRRLDSNEFLYNIPYPKVLDKLLLSNDRRLRRRFAIYVRPLKRRLLNRRYFKTGQIDCYINVGLESNISPEAAAIWHGWAREEFPRCKIVWNPLRRATTIETSKADYIEQHYIDSRFDTKKCIFNNDGCDLSFPTRISSMSSNVRVDENWRKRMLNYADQCSIVYLWAAEDNCFSVEEQKQNWKYPLRRSCNPGNMNHLIGEQLRWFHGRRR